MLSLKQQRQLAAECRVFADNSAAEFHKSHCGIWQNLPRKNGGPVMSFQLPNNKQEANSLIV